MSPTTSSRTTQVFEGNTITLDGESLTIEDVVTVARSWAAPEGIHVKIAAKAQEKIERARRAVEAFIERGEIIYGVTTGFGAFKDRVISPEQTEELQHNLLMSHAAGVGRPLDEATVRALMLIRANTLAKGHSGIRLETLEALLALIKRGVYPVIPAKGSLGASGDLAPLAHMSLVLIGEGEAFYRGDRMSGAEALRRAGLAPIKLGAKEGLALINGTAVMAAIGALTTWQAEGLSRVADVAGALSLEALHGMAQAFDERIHAARPHGHQMDCAAHLRRLVEGSEFLRLDDPNHVQDAYSLRCIPQVHGAVRAAISHARQVIETELDSATDNPLIFFEDDGRAVCLSGGNFHGEPLALVMDYLAIALAELSNISERRLARLLDETSNQGTLPAFLIRQGGLNSGFMMTQYTAAALASENKVLAHPASVDTIPTSANIEDHVSMGCSAALKAREVLENTESILALELLAAAQGVDFRREMLGGAPRLGKGTAVAYELIRQRVPFLEQDTIMYPYIEAVRELVSSGELVEAVAREQRSKEQGSKEPKS
ncbi:MAG: histidine ammonia-lyase [Chloroflexi bacterium]|nr:histidine ammonia-lyase [Chloroflexota bacterium]